MKKKMLSPILSVVLGAALLAGCGSAPTVEPVEKVSAVQETETAAPEEAEPAEVQEAAPAEAAPAEAAPAEAAPAEAAPAEAAPAEAAPAEAAPAEATPAEAAPAEAVPAEAAPAEAQEAVPAEAAPAEVQDAAADEALQQAEAAPAEEPATEAQETAPAEVQEALPEGQMYSYLTGEPIDTETGTKRPFAVMINNLEPAVPQSGIVNADILYEMFVESDITRLMAVFQDPGDLEKIGPVRSSRHNYLSLADDNEAVYAHFGWSIFAEALINEQGRTTINGMFYDGSMGFYRTDDRVAPHNAYVTAQGLRDIADSLGIDRSYPAGYEPNLHFNKADTPLASGEDAAYLRLGYPVDNPWFEYNADDQLYYRFEYGAPHVDMETGEQLKFKNVIVQFADQENVGDTYLLEIHVIKEGEGSGMYFTDGKAVPITWKKESWEDRTHYYTADGQPLNLNPGKTMIQIIPESYGVTYSATVEDAQAETAEWTDDSEWTEDTEWTEEW